MRQKKGSVLIPLALYHAGRIATYTVMGGMMGFAGSFTRVAQGLIDIQPYVLTGAGGLLLIMGLSMMGVFPRLRLFHPDYSASGMVLKTVQQLMTNHHPLSCLPMGLLLGLLPCGPVYVALTAAAGAGVDAVSPSMAMLSGMGIMACFGIGTAPALFVLGKVASLKMISSRVLLYRTAGVLVMASGGYFIFRGML